MHFSTLTLIVSSESFNSDPRHGRVSAVLQIHFDWEKLLELLETATCI